VTRIAYFARQTKQLARFPPLIPAVCTIALVAGYACQDDGALAPRRVPQADLEPTPPDSGAQFGVYTLPPVHDNNDALLDPGRMTGIEVQLPAGRAARVTVQGKLHFTQNNPAYHDCALQDPPPLPGGVTDVGPAGLDTGNRPYYVNVTVGTDTAPQGAALALQPQSVNADAVTAITGRSGALWVSRPIIWPGGCAYNPGGQVNPAYLVSGSQTISAELLPPAVIRVDRTTVVTGDTVTATPFASWTSDWWVSGWSWAWVQDPAPNGGSATFVSGCGYGAPSCRAAVFGDGHFQAVLVLAGGQVAQTAVSPTVHVAPARLVLVVDSAHVASGSQVKFTARRSDAQPVQVHSWVWTQGGGSPPGPLAAECVGGDSVCATVLQNTNPPGSTAQTGTMTAVALLGTARESASVAVTVDAPLVGGGCGAAPMASSKQVRRTAGRAVPLSCPPPTDTAVLTLTIDKYTLRPRIRAGSVNLVSVPEGQPDTANVTAVLTQGATHLSGVHVWIHGEFLPSTGGHAHIANPVRFEDSPIAMTGPEYLKPLVGYFLSGTQKNPYVELVTDGTGTATVKLVAGYLGGRARLIVEASVSGTGQAALKVDTVSYAVPSLVSLQTRIPITDVYWTGGNRDHAQGSNFYVQDSIAIRLQPIAEDMRQTVNGLYLQYNDASLPNGGAFTVTPSNAVIFEDPFVQEPGGHQAHNTGLDQDIGLCYAAASGDDGQVNRVLSSQCSGSSGNKVDQATLQREACQQHGVAQVHFQNHYHIRFVGSNDIAPGC